MSIIKNHFIVNVDGVEYRVEILDKIRIDNNTRYVIRYCECKPNPPRVYNLIGIISPRDILRLPPPPPPPQIPGRDS